MLQQTRLERILLLLILTLALSVVACGDDGGNNDPDVLTDVDVSDDTEDTDIGEIEDIPDATDPWVLVPPEAYEGDASACPAGFNMAMSGQNNGYMAGGQERSFYLQLPDDLSGPTPLFLGFNGTGQDGLAVWDFWGMQDFVDAGFIVLLPDSNGNGSLWPVWDGLHQMGEDQSMNADMDFVDSLVDCVATQYPIDANRMYAGGHSAGGIMTSFFLRSRSDIYAGGIIASGMSDLTNPDPVQMIDTMSVIVTWGGANDEYSGSANPDVTVPSVNFVEQAAIQSAFWEDKNNVNQVYCVGDDLGHTWLNSANQLFIDFLYAHPKGLADNMNYMLDTMPSDQVTCSEDAAEYTPPVVIECTQNESASCLSYCQFIADCVAENGTVAPVLGPQLVALGFSGENNAECGGCITACEMDAATGGQPDTDVLNCFEQAAGAGTCGPGVEGALPFIDAINSCCAGATDSEVCTRVCTSVQTNDIASQLATECAAF